MVDVYTEEETQNGWCTYNLIVLVVNVQELQNMSHFRNTLPLSVICVQKAAL